MSPSAFAPTLESSPSRFAITRNPLMTRFRFFTVMIGLWLSCTSLASAEILALFNYESKPDQPVRREGIAIMDIDPESVGLRENLDGDSTAVRPRRPPYLFQPR